MIARLPHFLRAPPSPNDACPPPPDRHYRTLCLDPRSDGPIPRYVNLLSCDCADVEMRRGGQRRELSIDEVSADVDPDTSADANERGMIFQVRTAAYDGHAVSDGTYPRKYADDSTARTFADIRTTRRSYVLLICRVNVAAAVTTTIDCCGYGPPACI